jgi:endonuclease/exonuclease/phosphatase family metal-dependent hydrolase
MRLATYNVHGFIGGDGQRDVARTAAVLAEVNAHVVALQEVEARADGDDHVHALDELTRLTGMTTIAGPTITDRGRDYGNALLTRVEIGTVRRHDLSVAGFEPRGAIAATLEPSSGPPLAVVATHLGLNAVERWRQVAALLALARSRSEPLVALLGDFNSWLPLSRSTRQLVRCFGRASSPPTFPARCPVLRLDRIWMRPAHTVVRRWTHRSPLARVASDHLPLCAETVVEGSGRE